MRARRQQKAAQTARNFLSLKEGDVLKGVVLAMTGGEDKAPLRPLMRPAFCLPWKIRLLIWSQRIRLWQKRWEETGGLGTVATRADIIEKLFSSFLLEKAGKGYFLTSKAKQLLELVPEDLKKPELTAQWEMKLSAIAKGDLKRDAFMEEIRDYCKELLRAELNRRRAVSHDNLTNTKCPVCGKRMLSVKGKNSQMLVCQDRACGHRETVSRTSNARCLYAIKKWSCGERERDRFSYAAAVTRRSCLLLRTGEKRKEPAYPKRMWPAT